MVAKIKYLFMAVFGNVTIRFLHVEGGFPADGSTAALSCLSFCLILSLFWIEKMLRLYDYSLAGR